MNILKDNTFLPSCYSFGRGGGNEKAGESVRKAEGKGMKKEIVQRIMYEMECKIKVNSVNVE